MRRITSDLLNPSTIKPTDRLGMMLSGGMDSALLLYLLSLNTQNEIVCFTIPKTDGAANYVNPIIAWVNGKLGRNIQGSKLIGNPKLYHSAIINEAIKSIENEYDFLYFAGNSYPSEILPGGPNRIKRVNPKHIQPFFDCYKTDIVRSYIEFGILDLILLTHTCTEWEFGRCNNCWQCRERAWAFNQLNIQDIGTL